MWIARKEENLRKIILDKVTGTQENKLLKLCSLNLKLWPDKPTFESVLFKTFSYSCLRTIYHRLILPFSCISVPTYEDLVIEY